MSVHKIPLEQYPDYVEPIDRKTFLQLWHEERHHFVRAHDQRRFVQGSIIMLFPTEVVNDKDQPVDSMMFVEIVVADHSMETIYHSYEVKVLKKVKFDIIVKSCEPVYPEKIEGEFAEVEPKELNKIKAANLEMEKRHTESLIDHGALTEWLANPPENDNLEIDEDSKEIEHDNNT